MNICFRWCLPAMWLVVLSHFHVVWASEPTVVEISMMSPYTIPNTAYTPEEVRERWEAKVTLRGGLAAPVVRLIKQVNERKSLTDEGYGSLVWRVWVFQGSETIADWYVDRINLVFVEDGKPYTAPPELIRLLDACEAKLNFKVFRDETLPQGGKPRQSN